MADLPRDETALRRGNPPGKTTPLLKDKINVYYGTKADGNGTPDYDDGWVSWFKCQENKNFFLF